MPKIFTKTTVVDEVLTEDARYNILEDGGGTFKSDMQIVLASPVATPGTSLNAALLNALENGVDGLDTLLAYVLDLTSVVTAAGTTTLTVNSNRTLLLTGSTTQIVVLPVVSTLNLGWKHRIINASSGSITVNSSGGNLVATVFAGEWLETVCVLTSGTDAASWTTKKMGSLDLANATNPTSASAAFIEAVQDAVGAMIDSTLSYVDATPLLRRAALTGDVTASAGSNATTIANNAVTLAKLATQAANTILANATAGAAVPTAVALAANQFLARSSAGNISAKGITDYGFTVLGYTSATQLRTGITAALDYFLFPITITTADVNATESTDYHCTIAGLTADRNFILPVATVAGVEIRVTILDGDDVYALIVKGAATVTINGGSAATEWCRLFIKGETITFRSTSDTNWQVISERRLDGWQKVDESWSARSQAYTNDPAAGSNIVLNMADTTGFVIGDIVTVSSSAGSETATITAVSANVSITVNTLGLNHTTTNPLVVSTSKITIPAGGTTRYRKGMSVRFKQGGAYKYYCISAITSTLITTIVNTDYTVANSAITDIYISTSGTALGFPQYFTRTTTGIVQGSGGSAGTYAQSATATYSIIPGGRIKESIYVNITNKGSWSGNVQVVAAVTGIANGGNILFGGLYPASGAPSSSRGIVGGPGASNLISFVSAVGAANLQWTAVVNNDFIYIDGDYLF